MSEEQARAAVVAAYVAMVVRAGHRPFDGGRRGKGTVAREGERLADRLLARVSVAELPDHLLVGDLLILAEARRELRAGHRDVARDLSALVTERLETAA